MLAIDTSDYMRNGDYYPTRLLAAQDAANILVGSKMQSNPENTIGFLCMGGASCVMKETLTGDVDRVMATMTRLPIGGKLHFANALMIASLALSYRSNPRAEKRIVAFVGSPILEDEKVLEKLAKKLRKDEVAVDIVSFGGIDGNDAILEKFMDAVNKQDNSRLLTVPRGSAIVDQLYSSAILIGNEAAAQQAAGGQGDHGGAPGVGGGFGGGFEFGVDPNIDPELAMVLRMSAEEERRRQEAAAGGGNVTTSSATAETSESAPTTSAAPVTRVEPVRTALPFQPPTDRPMTEEEEIELAIALSMQEAAGPTSSTQAEAPPTTNDAPPPQATFDPAFDAALQDPDFLAQLEAELQGGVAEPKDKKEDDKNKDGDAEQE